MKYSQNSVSVNRSGQSFIPVIITLTILSSAVCAAGQTNIKANTAGQPAQGHNEKLLELVPRDASMVYSYYPAGSGQSFGRGMAHILSAAGILGFFDTGQQSLADMVNIAIKLSRYPHVISLLDVSSTELGPGSFALDEFSAVVIVKSGEDYNDFIALLKQVIDHYFTTRNAGITWTGEGEARHQKLSAENLPGWACWEWGRLNGMFVFTIGKNAYTRVVEQISPKSRENRTGFTERNVLLETAEAYDSRIDPRAWMIYFNVDQLTRALKPVLGRYYESIIYSLELRAMGRRAEDVMITAGFKDQAFVTKLYLLWPNSIELRYITEDMKPDNPLTRIIPAKASVYAFAPVDISETMSWAGQSYLSMKNPQTQAEIRRNYRRIITKHGIEDSFGQFFDHLGPGAIIHDYPRHPLNWPFAKTIVIPHDKSEEVRKNWKAYLRAWQEILRLLNDGDQTAPDTQPDPASWLESLLSFQLSRTENDIWFLHVGPLVLAAGAINDSEIIVSWSARAVEYNLKYLSASSSGTGSHPSAVGPTSENDK